MAGIIATCGTLALVGACSHKSVAMEDTSVAHGYSPQADTPTPLPLPANVRVMDTPKRKMLQATAFRMSGDFSDNVGITMGENGMPVYFPAPTDITADSKPVSLGNGWWLNRQGIGPNSVFTSYTFARYAELPMAPDIEQLKNSIIPGARVTEMIELPFNAREAEMHLDEIRQYVSDK